MLTCGSSPRVNLTALPTRLVNTRHRFERSASTTGSEPTRTRAPVASIAPASASSAWSTTSSDGSGSASRSPRPAREYSSRSRISVRACCVAPRIPSMRSEPSAPERLAALQQLGVHRDRRQRRLQVVRGDRGELLELGVGARELGVGALELGLAALERVGHRVEAAREVADLVLAARRHAGRQIPGRELAGRVRDAHDRPHDRPSQVQREPERHDDDEAEAADPDADRQRRLALGGILALATSARSRLASARRSAPSARTRLAVGRVEELVAAARGCVARELDEGVAPRT